MVTKEEILTMEAGRELDRLVAVEVMNEAMPSLIPEDALALQLAGSPIKSPGGNWLCLCEYEEGDIPTWHPLPFTTDISAAWLVVNKFCNWDNRDAMLTLKGQGENPTPLEGNGEWWEVIIDDDSGRQWQAEGKTATEVICKGALLTRLANRLVDKV